MGEPEFNWDDALIKTEWKKFTQFGNANATEMSGKNFDKWLKDANVIDKNITTTVTGIAFSKVSGPLKKKTLNFKETRKALSNVAEDRARNGKKDMQEELDLICQKLSEVEAPKVNSAAKTNTSGGVFNRLTDTKGYTGSHKERFDGDGKGRGKAGRVEDKNDSGYVGAYRNAGTYDKTKGSK